MPNNKEAKGYVRDAQRQLYVQAIGQAGGSHLSAGEFCSNLSALLTAYSDLRRRRHKLARGVDGRTILKIEAGVGRNEFLREISKALTDGAFNFLPARQYRKPKKSGGYRTIGVSSFRCAVVLRVLLMYLGPKLDHLFCESSYGFRPTRGVPDAFADVAIHMRNHDGKVLRITGDVRDCFDSLQRPLLWELLERDGVDNWCISLLKAHLAAGAVTPEGRLEHPELGVHQGAAVSGILMNRMLHEADLAVEREINSRSTIYVRYADDILIAQAGTTREALRTYSVIGTIFSDQLSLELVPSTPAGRHMAAAGQWMGYLGAEFRRDPKCGKMTSRITRPRTKLIREYLTTAVKKVRPRDGESALYEAVHGEMAKRLNAYTFTAAVEPFARIDHHVDYLALRWLRRRHRRWDGQRQLLPSADDN